MMSLIPTYVVQATLAVSDTTAGHEHTLTFRVPQTQLAAFIDVLLFNKCGAFKVEQEPMP